MTARRRPVRGAAVGDMLAQHLREGVPMASKYWWQCTACGARPSWLTVCDSKSIAAFIRDELAPSGWDQRLLRRTCECRRRALYITYRLKRGDPERVSVR